MGSSFAPNHIGMPLVSPKLKLDFLRRQVLMSRNISGGWPVSIFMGGLNYQIEHHLFPSMARPHLRKAQPLVSAYCAANGVPYTQTESVAGIPNRHQLPQQRRAPRQGPLPLPPRRATPRTLNQSLRITHSTGGSSATRADEAPNRPHPGVALAKTPGPRDSGQPAGRRRSPDQPETDVLRERGMNARPAAQAFEPAVPRTASGEAANCSEKDDA